MNKLIERLRNYYQEVNVMENNTELINLLNDFLVGIDMGTDTFRSYEEKLESDDLKNEFKKILSTFVSYKEIVVFQVY